MRRHSRAVRFLTRPLNLDSTPCVGISDVLWIHIDRCYGQLAQYWYHPVIGQPWRKWPCTKLVYWLHYSFYESVILCFKYQSNTFLLTFSILCWQKRPHKGCHNWSSLTDEVGQVAACPAWDAPVNFVRLLPREILAHTEAMPHRELFDWAFFEEEQMCLFVFIHFGFISVKEFDLLEIWRHFVFGECREYFAAPADWQFCLLLGNYERIITAKLAIHLFLVETWGWRGYSASVVFRIFMGFTFPQLFGTFSVPSKTSHYEMKTFA